MPALTPAPPASIDDAPIDLLETALSMMIADEQHECAFLLLLKKPALLGYVRTCVDPESTFVDYPPLKARFPKQAFHLQNRRARARALASLGGQDMDERIKALEERLAAIRHDVEQRAIGSPFPVANAEVAAMERE